jgi:hypothetical protein
MYGVHQPDIFLEQCRCSHSVSCFGVTRNLTLRHRYTISLQNYKFHRTSQKKGKTFVLWNKSPCDSTKHYWCISGAGHLIQHIICRVPMIPSIGRSKWQITNANPFGAHPKGTFIHIL